MNLSQTFAANLTAIYKAKHKADKSYNIYVLAKDVGVSIQAISCWMNGHHFPMPDNIDKLAESLGVDFREFFR